MDLRHGELRLCALELQLGHRLLCSCRTDFGALALKLRQDLSETSSAFVRAHARCSRLQSRQVKHRQSRRFGASHLRTHLLAYADLEALQLVLCRRQPDVQLLHLASVLLRQGCQLPFMTALHF